MAMTAWPRVNEATTDAQYAELFDSVIGTGVRDAAELKVDADSSGLNVKVAAGFAVVAGSAFLSTAAETLAIAGNSTTNPRVDAIILRRDFSQSPAVVTLLVKQGTAGSNATAPALTQQPKGVYEELLATVAVAAGAATITSANVSDRRSFLSSRVGVWTTAKRPPARAGRIGFNTELSRWEGHDGSTWGGLLPAILPLTQGGTGGNTPATARSSLGIRSGTAAPNNADGADGDIYFQVI
ncbi:membrane protein [Microbacterium phage phiMiGM15]